MTTSSPSLWTPNPELDLVLERDVDVPRQLVWAAWTTPKHLEQWFCPKPWRATDFVLDLRPGGEFSSVMHGPNGEVMPNKGCFLEVVPQERLVFTDTLLPGFRPSSRPFFTAVVQLQTLSEGRTRYVAMARHGDTDKRKQHEEMGFHHGWGAALDQLVALAKAL
jgi:uncharacterized protein YndB with AHSA1/START domain